MFNAVALAIILLDAWGMIGIWSSAFGFHHTWEVWAYVPGLLRPGLLVCPWYSFSQIMISEVTPRAHEFLFFSLFSIIGKTSTFIGPVVSSAFIDAAPSHDASLPFYFFGRVECAQCGGFGALVGFGGESEGAGGFLKREGGGVFLIHTYRYDDIQIEDSREVDREK